MIITLYVYVYHHIAASGWIITGSRIVLYTIHEIQQYTNMSR